MVTVLFARADSIYKTLGVDVYDIARDARTWPGGTSVVAHPPCRAWASLRHFAKPRPDEKELAIWAVDQVRKWGGVLEHPRFSTLWPTLNLPMPGQRDYYGGFTLCVNQFWWGHRAVKKTFLYIVGCEPKEVPPIPLRFDAVQHVVATRMRADHPRRVKKLITDAEREATPPDFAKWLIDLAEICQRQKR